MTSTELITALAIDSPTLAEWIQAGLPFKKSGRSGKSFDPAEVQAWLLANGHAKKPNVVPTIDAAADELGVHRGTLREWIRKGAPAKTADGQYDVDAIAAWRNEHYAAHDPMMNGAISPALDRYRNAKAQREELALAREIREIYPREIILRFFNTMMTQHRWACQVIMQQNLSGVDAVEGIRQAFADGREQIKRMLATPAAHLADFDDPYIEMEEEDPKPQAENGEHAPAVER